MSSQTLRAWQSEAFSQYQRTEPRDFLTVATPGSGKTTFALTIAADLLYRRVVDQIVVVAPTEHLKSQWAEAAQHMGIALEPNIQGALSRDFQGYAVTYAGLAVNPTAHRVRIERTRSFVILDEVHHAGDALSWGEAVRESCEPAERRLCLTGTPFRSDDNPIPFVTYAPQGDGSMASVADYAYGYGSALADGVVRPVLFMAYSGEMQWRTRAGDEVSARLGEPLTKDYTAHALRTALDPNGSWIPEVFLAAHRRLQEVRRDIPDAAGLVIAADQTHARAYAKLMTQITGIEPTLVLSDEEGSSSRIAQFARGTSEWMVAVRMVSEGVDVPRLAVGVYATTTTTPLFFAQAVGRFVRTRRRGETASVFVPSIPRLLLLASELEAERDHVIGKPVHDEGDLFAAEEALIARANRTESAPDMLGDFAALDSRASFDRFVFDGAEIDGSGFDYDRVTGDHEELDFLGIPGLLEPDQVAELLRSARGKKQTTRAVSDVAHERRSELRRELNSLVAAWNHRTGTPHGVTHNQLRSATGGMQAAQATSEDLQKRIDLLREWALRASG